MSDARSNSELEELLRRDARTRDEVLREAAEAGPAPGEEQALDLLCAQLPPAPPARRWLWLAAAAVLLFTALVVFWPGDPDGPGAAPDGPSLLSGDRDAHPVDEVAEWGEFLWRLPLGPGEQYRFELFDGDGAPGAEPLVRETELTEARWTPPPDLRLPSRIRWRVTAVSGGAPTGAAIESLAWLEDEPPP